jgi:voltage-gated potassium channel
VRLNVHHRRALAVLSGAVLLDIAAGLAFGAADHVGTWDGLYWATTTATTVGYGDLVPHGWLPHALAVACMVTVIPLFASVFSLVTTGFTASHVDKRHDQMTNHVTTTAGGGA